MLTEALMLAEIRSMMNDMNTMIERDHRRDNPIHKMVWGAIVIPAAFTNPTIVTVTTTPAPGRVWNVRWVGIFFSSSTSTSPLGISMDTFGGMPSFLYTDTSGLADSIYTNIGPPNDAFFHRDVYWVWPGEYIWSAIYGPTLSSNVGKTFQVVARVTEHNIEDMQEAFLWPISEFL